MTNLEEEILPKNQPASGWLNAPEFIAFRSKVREFVDAQIRPHVEMWESQATLPRTLFQKFGQAGFFRTMLADRLPRRDFRHSVILTEELCRPLYAGVAVSLMLQTNSTIPVIDRFCTPQLKREVLDRVIAGDAIVSLAATEPTGGSDLVNSINTECLRDGDEFILRGEKTYITNAPIADYVIALARVRGAVGGLAFNAFLVPTSTPGFEQLPALEKLGLHASPTGRFRLNDCRVPLTHLLGKERFGITYFSQALHHERLLIACASLSVGLHCLSHIVRAVPFDIRSANTPCEVRAADALTKGFAQISAQRASVLRIASDAGAGQLDIFDSAMAKATAPKLLQTVLRSLVETCGPYLTATDRAALDRVDRDTRILSIFAGSTETMLDLASLRLGAIVRVGGNAIYGGIND